VNIECMHSYPITYKGMNSLPSLLSDKRKQLLRDNRALIPGISSVRGLLTFQRMRFHLPPPPYKDQHTSYHMIQIGSILYPTTYMLRCALHRSAYTRAFLDSRNLPQTLRVQPQSIHAKRGVQQLSGQSIAHEAG